MEWCWTSTRNDDFEAVKESLLQVPVLALPDHERPFSMVGVASGFSMVCALLQDNPNDHERVVAYESCQMKAAENEYPVMIYSCCK